MSKSSLATLKSEINRESRSVNSAQSSLNDVIKDVGSAMNDRVGASAQESLRSINRTFTYHYDLAYKNANEAATSLERGYSELSSSLSEAKAILSSAEKLFKELGDL